MSTRAFKHTIVTLLTKENLESIVIELENHTPSKLLNPLFSGLCSGNEKVKWHAIVGMGKTVARLADANMESARIVMRRLIWSLNDESGGIGWGAPEALAEIMVCHETLAAEYGHMLVAYMREDGCYLEYEPLQRGLMWGIGRLAQVQPDLLLKKNTVRYLMPYMESQDPVIKGLAAWSLGILQAREAVSSIELLIGNKAQVSFYLDGTIVTKTVDDLAREALARISHEYRRETVCRKANALGVQGDMDTRRAKI